LRGAIIFIVAFLIFLIATLAYSDLPPGKIIYDSLSLPETDYLVLGIGATTLIAATFNGVIYGVIAWLAYTLAERFGLIPKKTPSTT
jgi:hypothetical protein